MYKKIFAKCSSGITEKCKKFHEISYSSFCSNKKRNNGKYKCRNCARYGVNLTLKVNNDFFDEISEIQSYMIGIIAGDGNLKNNTIRIVSHNKDIETLNLFKKYICPDSKICKYRNSNCYYISFTSHKISKIVYDSLSVKSGKKSNIIQMPDFCEDLCWHFIRGLMDSDGSIRDLKNSKHTIPKCCYSSKSEKIKEQIKVLCDKYEISYVTDKLSIIFNGQHCIKFLNKVYNNSNYKLSRKYLLYIDSKQWVSGNGNPFRPYIKRGPRKVIK